MRFLFGFVTGMAACLILVVVLALIFTPSATKSLALDSLAGYREAALRAPVDQAEKDTAVAQLDRIIARVHERGISFWEFSTATSDIDPLTEDRQLTAAEWPKFAEEVRTAEIILVGSPEEHRIPIH